MRTSLSKGDALNNAAVKTRKSDLITVEVIPAKTAPAKEKDKDGKETAAPAKAEPIVPFALCGGSGDSLVLTLQGGSNGSVRTVTADAFLGRTTVPADAPASRPSRKTAMSPSWPSPASPLRRCRRR